jgi:N utilization substance protein B
MTADPGGVERHRGREAALQLLYQWEVGALDQTGLNEAIEFYWSVHPAPEPRRKFTESLVAGTTAHVGEIDPLLEGNTDNWRLSRLAVVDRLIMRMAVYELVYSATPAAVIIDEAIELARTYGGEQTVPFVNGVLDSINRNLKEQGNVSEK